MAQHMSNNQQLVRSKNDDIANARENFERLLWKS